MQIWNCRYAYIELAYADMREFIWGCYFIMKLYYFKRYWDETTGDPSTNSWGTSTYYFETDMKGEVLRQIEVYQNGKKLRYDENKIENEYGGISDQPLDLTEFDEFKIDKEEFEQAWAREI